MKSSLQSLTGSLPAPRRRVLTLGLLLVIGLADAAFGASQTEAPPRLVLQITVDQLRGDMLPRLRERFGSGGIRLLLDHGVYYANAHYDTANTVTCSGHAVLVTGADAAEHGIAGNMWFDRELGRPVYCVRDPRYPTVGAPSKPGGGLSPAHLTSTTVGDELVSASGHRARVFAIAGKDRSAIIPGGRLGKAFWFSEAAGGFVTSRYYYDTLPNWAAAWNDRKLYKRYEKAGWKLLHPLETYINAALASNPHAHVRTISGRTFPHMLTSGANADLLKALRFTPFLDELTADFALELLEQEKLGQRLESSSGEEVGPVHAATDYLSISFSATDYVGHTYGPNSIEAEDNLLRLDATLARLFAYIDRTIGLSNTIVVLSSDHGTDDIPEERKHLGYDADRLAGEALRTKLDAALKQRFEATESLVAAVVPPGVYLDRANVAALRLDPAVVEAAVVEVLQREPGVAYAFTRTDLLAGRIGRTPLLDRVQRAFHPTRSGDVVVIQRQFWYFDDEPDYYAAMHGSPYTYDTHVPILMLAPGARRATIHDPVTPAQIAPTIAALLGVKPPSGCACGAPLPGVF